MNFRLIYKLLILLLLAGCARSNPDLFPDDPDERAIQIYVIELDWHTEIAVPVYAFQERLPDHPEFPSGNTLLFGWGDAEYFPSRDPGFNKLLSAALIPTRSVLHVTGLNRPVYEVFPEQSIVEIEITNEGLRELATFISNQFHISPENELIFLSDGYYQNSAFFEASESYYFPRTSNNWTARALRSAGYPISPSTIITSGQLLRKSAEQGTWIHKKPDS